MRKAVIIAVLVLSASCSPKVVDRIVYRHDTTQVVRVDSVRYWQKDSVYIREKGDTVFKYVERIRYRDRFHMDTLLQVREIHDTTVVERKVEKELSVAQKAKIGAFWWLLAGLVATLCWIFRKPLLGWFTKVLKMIF